MTTESYTGRIREVSLPPGGTQVTIRVAVPDEGLEPSEHERLIHLTRAEFYALVDGRELTGEVTVKIKPGKLLVEFASV